MLLPAVSNRRVVDFGKGVGRRSVYLYNLPEVTSGHQVCVGASDGVDGWLGKLLCVWWGSSVCVWGGPYQPAELACLGHHEGDQREVHLP